MHISPDVTTAYRPAKNLMRRCTCAAHASIIGSASLSGDLNGAFVPPDKLADPIIDACAAHVQRLIRFFAGR